MVLDGSERTVGKIGVELADGTMFCQLSESDSSSRVWLANSWNASLSTSVPSHSSTKYAWDFILSLAFAAKTHIQTRPPSKTVYVIAIIRAKRYGKCNCAHVVRYRLHKSTHFHETPKVPISYDPRPSPWPGYRPTWGPLVLCIVTIHPFAQGE